MCVHNIWGESRERKDGLCLSEIGWDEEWGALVVLSGSSAGRTGLDLYVRVS